MRIQQLFFAVLCWGLTRGQNLRTVSSSNNERRLQSNPAFIEDSGLVVMNAESVPFVAPWKFEKDVIGYTGPGFIRFDGNSVYGGDPSGMLSYFFEIKTPGEYMLVMRLRKNTAPEGDHRGLGNDCYIRMPGQPGYLGQITKAFIAGSLPINTWRWFTKLEVDHDAGFFPEPVYNLEADKRYELQVWGRSKNLFIDRLILYKMDSVDFNYAKDLSRPESRRVGQGAAPTPAPVAVPVTPKPVAVPVTRSPVAVPVTPSPVPPVPIPSPPSIKLPPLSQGRWIETQVDAPIDKRHEACFVMVDNQIAGKRAYLVGGRGNKDLDIYDPVSRTWSKGTPPPTDQEIHHMQCVSAEGKLWIVAAWKKYFPNEENADHVYVYDPATNSWSTKTPMPVNRRRGSAAVVVVGNRIYVSHGNIGGHEEEGQDFATSVGWIDYYDISTNKWTALEGLDAPNPRDHTGGALIGNKICVAGGRDGGTPGWPLVAPTDCFDLSTNKWSVMPDIPNPRAGSSYGQTCDGKLMVAGGEGNDKAWSNVDVFDGTKWMTIDNLNIQRHGSGLAMDCECQTITVASGNDQPFGGSEIRSVETFFYSGSDTQCGRTPEPTASPTAIPTANPTASPTGAPTIKPSTASPTGGPTVSPTSSPTTVPTVSPTASPMMQLPAATPTSAPSLTPVTNAPSMTEPDTVVPTTMSPTAWPTMKPTTASPAKTTMGPTTASPTPATSEPTTASPTPVTLEQTTASPTPTTMQPTTASPAKTTMGPTTASPTPATLEPTTASPTPATLEPTTASPTPATMQPTTASPTPPTVDPTSSPSTAAPSTSVPESPQPTTSAPIQGTTPPPVIAPSPAPTTSAPISKAPVPATTGVIGELALTDAGTGSYKVIQILNDGDIINIHETGNNLSVLAEMTQPVGNVRFFYGESKRVIWYERFAPYTMAGNIGDNVYVVDYLKTPGEKTVKVNAYDADDKKIDSKTIKFTLVDVESTPAPSTAAPSTAAPSTATPSMPEPTTAAPSPAPVSPPTMVPSTQAPVAAPTPEPGKDWWNWFHSTECFSGVNSVDIYGHASPTKPMSEVAIGDYVRTRTGYSRVISLGHVDKDIVATFLQIYASGLEFPLELTAGHLVFVNNKIPVRARDVKVGDKLWGEYIVTSIQHVERKGIYAPVTESGEIVVSGVLSSCFVAPVEDLSPSIQHRAAQMFLSPLRLACSARFDICQNETHTDGRPDYVWTIAKAVHAIMGLPRVIQFLALIVAVIVTLVFAFVEQTVLCGNGILAAALAVLGFLFFARINTKIVTAPVKCKKS